MNPPFFSSEVSKKILYIILNRLRYRTTAEPFLLKRRYEGRVGNQVESVWGLMVLQSSQPHLGIINLSYARVSVYPEVEEFITIN